MQVVLLERVLKLGQMGEIVNVKPGYARNFLLPQKKALRATKANLEQFETQRVHLEAENLKRRGEAEKVAEKMVGVNLTLIRQASETGQLYGSVRSLDISAALNDAGYKVNRSQIQLLVPIKTIGLHTAQVVLHPEVIISVKVLVAKSEEEAEVQLELSAASTPTPAADAE